MAIRFQSRATADVLMLDAVAERLLALMGKTPAPQGIVTVAQLAGARTALQAAVLQSEAPAAETDGALPPPTNTPPATPLDTPVDAPRASTSAERMAAPRQTAADPDDEPPAPVVSLRQRAAPLLALLAEAERANCDVTWTR